MIYLYGLTKFFFKKKTQDFYSAQVSEKNKIKLEKFLKCDLPKDTLEFNICEFIYKEFNNDIMIEFVNDLLQDIESVSQIIDITAKLNDFCIESKKVGDINKNLQNVKIILEAIDKSNIDDSNYLSEFNDILTRTAEYDQDNTRDSMIETIFTYIQSQNADIRKLISLLKSKDLGLHKKNITIEDFKNKIIEYKRIWELIKSEKENVKMKNILKRKSEKTTISVEIPDQYKDSILRKLQSDNITRKKFKYNIKFY